ncbi:MAG: SpoIIE family protein phosphatase [Nocardioides sp.]|uniref:SpoIIE family protein phosphatase n=1 Tax=Nocardioides sp. TaxID=35761 RepID=UPI0039E3EE89
MADEAEHTPAYGPVDLDTCAAEPIHVPGAIQPHGVLVAFDHDLTVVMVSTNLREELGVAAEDAVGRPLGRVVGDRLATRVGELRDTRDSGEPFVATLDELPPAAGFAGVTADLKLNRSGERWLLELEPVGRRSGAALTYHATRGPMARLAEAETVVDLAARLAVEIRAILGFDRVMVYRFDEDWNGEVIAEARQEELNSFLGLHYPATDIPAQARRLYEINWTRLIADIGYRPVPLHPVLDPATDAPLDLSFSTLRSVSPIHVEYLSHMGVGASMSISLLIDDKLWGLVACHHYSGPHRPSHDDRAAAEFLGRIASQLVRERERSDAREATLRSRIVVGDIAARVAKSERPPLETLLEDPDVLDLMSACGAAVCSDGRLAVRGEVLPESDLRRVADALFAPGTYVTATDRVEELVPGLPPDSGIAGVLRIGTDADQWVLWLRPELQRVVDWGGDPGNKELVETESGSVRLSPRKSFEKWRELVRGRSEPWRSWEVEGADHLGKHVIAQLLSRSREQIAVAELLQRSVGLDHAPSYPGIEVAARYRAATSYQLGGDWWDAFDLGGGRIALAIGDVAGHGIEAVSAMTQMRTALRAYLFEGHSPAQCLDRLDRLIATLLTQRVATAIVAIANPAAGTVEIACAGHPQPLLVVDGSAISLTLPIRPVLGLGGGQAVTATLELPEGAALLCYTDGLVERRDIDLDEETRRLARFAGEVYDVDDLEPWLDRIMTFGLADGRDDDTTLLAIRMRPDAG